MTILIKYNLNIGSKTQNVENLCLDLIFYNNLWQNIKSFSKLHSKLKIHSKPDRNQLKLTVCNGNPDQIANPFGSRVIKLNGLSTCLRWVHNERSPVRKKWT